MTNCLPCLPGVLWLSAFLPVLFYAIYVQLDGNHMIGFTNTVRRVGIKIGQSKSKMSKCACHVKARIEIYPRTKDVKRFPVPDEKVPWSVPYPEYNPTIFTTPTVLSGPYYADPDIVSNPETSLKWNEVDGRVSRESYEGKYDVVDGLPRNPMGRTGLTHRGCLGRWGPNHAADPVVTRWKRDEDGNIIKDENGKNIAQFVAVQRRDNQEWAIPGGMVDPGSKVSATIKQEFGEEALNSLEMSEEEKKRTAEMIDNTLSEGTEGKVDAGEVVSDTVMREFGEEALATKEISLEDKAIIMKSIQQFFQNGEEIYVGYVDDPRNTDNAWMETTVYNFHDEAGDDIGRFNLKAGDDAQAVQWMDIGKDLNLYASHTYFLQKTAEKINASW